MTSKDMENGVIHKYVIWDHGKLNLDEKQMHSYISSSLGSILTKRLFCFVLHFMSDPKEVGEI